MNTMKLRGAVRLARKSGYRIIRTAGLGCLFCPERKTIEIGRTAAFPLFSLAHEVGHFLCRFGDFQAEWEVAFKAWYRAREAHKLNPCGKAWGKPLPHVPRAERRQYRKALRWNPAAHPEAFNDYDERLAWVVGARLLGNDELLLRKYWDHAHACISTYGYWERHERMAPGTWRGEECPFKVVGW